MFPLTKESPCFLRCCLKFCVSPSPGDSSEPLVVFPIGGRGWSDGWEGSKSGEGAAAEPKVQEVVVASLSCTITGDRLIRLGSEWVTGNREKGTCLFRILIGANKIGRTCAISPDSPLSQNLTHPRRDLSQDFGENKDWRQKKGERRRKNR